MKRFILKILSFAIPVLFVLMLLECVIRNIPNDYSYKKQYIEANCKQIEILILGSSHAYFGLNPEYFTSDNTFNAGYVSQSLNFDYKILRKYWEEFANLKTIIIPISYFSLWFDLSTGSEAWRAKNYALYYGIGNYSVKDNLELFGNKGSIVEKLKTYYLENKSIITSSRLGWGTTYKSTEKKDLIITGATAAKRHTKDIINSKENEARLEENIKTLKSIVELCKKKKIHILFFTPPAYQTYRKNLNPFQLSKTIETMSEITKDSSISKYVNLIDCSFFYADDFYDADHLNEIGAEKLSILVKSFIANPTNAPD